MRLYFHLANGTEVIRDPDGVEVADVEQAHVEALQTLFELRREARASGLDWMGWRLDIVNGSGFVVFSVSLDAIGH